jgi:pSer/pThr/pTyr-binding forkhead associated (FHA) protein
MNGKIKKDSLNNHTYVNGKEVSSESLLNGDKVTIGKNIFMFQLLGEE